MIVTGLFAPDLWPAVLSFVVLAGMFALFVSDRFPAEVVAMSGAAILLGAGVVPEADAVAVFQNTAVWTIATMFIISAALVRTGVLASFSSRVTEWAGARRALLLGFFAVFCVVASAFMNNTPVVVMLIPVAFRIAQSIGTSPSKLMIPLSYVTVLGGLCTMIGTSTNLLVDGVARSAGLQPFHLFEVAPIGIALSVVGILYLVTVGRYLLPDRSSAAAMLGERKSLKYFTEVAIPQGSPLIGRRALEIDIFRREGMRVIDVLRGDESLRRDFPEVTLMEGDRVVLRTSVDELLGLKQSRAIHVVEQLSSRKTVTVEALITPGCKLVGRSLGRLRLRRRYGVYPLAVHRRNENITGMGRQMDEVVVRVGDTLLLEGAPEDIQRLASDVELVDLAHPVERPYRRNKAPLVLAVLAGVVGLSSLGLVSIFLASVIGVTIVLLAGCIDADEAFEAVDGRLLAMLFGMLTVGKAMEVSGAVRLIVDAVAPTLAAVPDWAMIACVFVFCQILTELLSNNTVGVVMTPIAIGLAQSLDVDPRPLVVAVMMAASASFATPIGYQTNMLVMGPGGYRFTDYTKVGLPLSVLCAVVATIVIPIFWPL